MSLLDLLIIATMTALAAGCSATDGNGASPSTEAGVDARDDREDPRDGAADGATVPCQPVNIAHFVPPPVVGFPPPSTVCQGLGGDGGLVAAYADACLGHAATYASCAAFPVPDAGAAADCYRCLVSVEAPGASAYGAVVVATVPLVDYVACIQALDPTEAGAKCAQQVTASAACSEYSCKGVCPVTDQASQYAYVACANGATSGACAGYALQAESCLAAEQGDGGTPVATICFAGVTAADHYFGVARYLCGAD